MNLTETKLNTNCVVKQYGNMEEKNKIRLMELGLIEGSVVSVYKKSILKKTLLIICNSGCFTIKDNLAKYVMVEYV